MSCRSHLPLPDYYNYIWPGIQVTKRINVIFSSLISFHACWVQVFSTPCSKTPSVRIRPLISETKFLIHTKTTE
jgi:hypothetical protein